MAIDLSPANYSKKEQFLGQSSLRRCGVGLAYSKEEVQEILSCIEDPLYFMKYVKITTLDSGVQTFTPFKYQEKFLKIMTENRFTIGMLPRQMGKTTIVGSFALHQLIFNQNYTIAIMANKMSTAKEIFTRFQESYEALPKFLQHGVREWNKTSCTLENGSKIFCAPTSKTGISGKSVNLLILDEFSKVPNATEFYTATYPVISSGNTSKVVIISTPFGDNLFKELWDGAQNKTNKYAPYFAHWSEHPKRNLAWKEATLTNIGQSNFDQEYECKFEGSGGTLISGFILEHLKAVTPISELDGVRIFEKPSPGHFYITVADVAEGIGADSSTFIIFDLTFWHKSKIKVVATYENNKMTPEAFPPLLHKACTFYNEAFFINENNSVGRSVGVNMLGAFEYENTLQTSVRKGSIKINGAGGVPGIKTTSSVKKVGCSRMRKLIEQGVFELNDSRIIKQLKVFSVLGNNRFGAQPGHHDDLITPLWILGFLTQLPEFKRMVSDNLEYSEADLDLSVIDQYDENDNSDEWDPPEFPDHCD